MVYNIFTYQRPCARLPSSVDLVELKNKRTSSSSSSRPTSSSAGSSKIRPSGIPDELSFDTIISGGTCPPMTTRDFLKYMIYVEHGAENLQFFLWHRDYVKRFKKLPDSQKILSPEFDFNAHPEVTRPKTAKSISNSSSPSAVTLVEQNFDDCDLDDEKDFECKHDHTPTSLSPLPAARPNPFKTPPRTPTSSTSPTSGNMPHLTPFETYQPVSISAIDHKTITAEAFRKADVDVKDSIRKQPMRDEISRIISIYLTEGAPRELNISERDRTGVIQALATTTHPSAFLNVQKHIEEALRQQSHPNFVRWSIANGNRPRVMFARALGIMTILAGFVVAILLTLSTKDRGMRAIATPLWLIGFSTLYAAMNGMCVVLHGLHRYNVRPWELWNDDEDFEKAQGSKYNYDSPATNSYETEPWIERYKNRFFLRKVFEKEMWVQEPALRQIQDTIAIQGMAIALVSSGILTAIFVCLPSGHVF